MRLVELTANQDGFKTVRFNPVGLTLIVGSQSRKGQTYNGVGKSLIVHLIHFCLGSDRNPEFEKKIPGWEFTLKFELFDATHTVSRNTSSQEVVFLDHQQMKVRAFTDWIGAQVIGAPEGVKGITFRALLPKFLRRGQKEYVDPRYTGERKEYDMLLRNSFLLGLEVSLVARKAALRDEVARIEQLKKNFKTDPLLKDFYSGGKDANIHLAHLEQRIRKLEEDKNSFVVAENYHELRRQADEIAKEIETTRNLEFLLRSSLENIEKSVREQPDLPLDRLQRLYGELTAAFRQEVLKSLAEVSSFHERILANRIARLSAEKVRIGHDLKKVQISLQRQQESLDRLLGLLGKSQALEQYTTLVNLIADLQIGAQKLRDYQAIDREYTDREASLKAQMGEEVIATSAYLDETRNSREASLRVFSQYANVFYPNRIAGISIQNNAGENRNRFDLNVHIENDSSDGINEVRIFCYDLALLTLGARHEFKFIFHDSRLYANMDVRQRATLFKLADKVTREKGFQYIATLNPDFISGMASEFSPEEFKRVVTDSIVLELKDDSASGKLLGINVDMKYE